MGLTLDVGFRSLALVVEGVEVLLKAGVGGDARIDGAAKDDLAFVPFHRLTSWKARACRGGDTPVSIDSFVVGVALLSLFEAPLLAGFSPKKRCPFQFVPVIALATRERLR
jgi:hypothetical protein